MQKRKYFATNRNVKKSGKKYTKPFIFFDFLNSFFEIKIMIMIMIQPKKKKLFLCILFARQKSHFE